MASVQHKQNMPMHYSTHVGLGDIGIYCHDISWQKVLWYYYISQYFTFFQSKTNYTIEGIVVRSGYIYCYTLHEVYIQTFKQPFIIKYMPCTHTNKSQTIILLQQLP